MSIERAVKIVGYLTLLGAISYVWIEVAAKAHSQITEKIREEVKESL